MSRCWICPTETTKRCGGCKRALYCSVECQREDRAFHKNICPTYAALPSTAMIITKIMLTKRRPDIFDLVSSATRAYAYHEELCYMLCMFAVQIGMDATQSRYRECIETMRVCYPMVSSLTDACQEFNVFSHPLSVVVSLDYDSFRFAGVMLYTVFPTYTIIHHMYIAPPIQRRGNGRSYVTSLRKCVSTPIIVFVVRTDAAALAFWRACGFVESHTFVHVQPDQVELQLTHAGR